MNLTIKFNEVEKKLPRDKSFVIATDGKDVFSAYYFRNFFYENNYSFLGFEGVKGWIYDEESHRPPE